MHLLNKKKNNKEIIFIANFNLFIVIYWTHINAHKKYKQKYFFRDNIKNI